MALRFLTMQPPVALRSDDHPVTATSVILGFRDGSSQEFDSSSPAGRAFRALAEVLALRSRTVRVSEET